MHPPHFLFVCVCLCIKAQWCLWKESQVITRVALPQMSATAFPLPVFLAAASSSALRRFFGPRNWRGTSGFSLTGTKWAPGTSGTVHSQRRMAVAHYLVIIFLWAARVRLASLPFVPSFPFVLFLSPSSLQLSPSPCAFLSRPYNFNNLPYTPVFCCGRWEWVGIKRRGGVEAQSEKKNERATEASDGDDGDDGASGTKLSHFHSQSVVKLASLSEQSLPALWLLPLNSPFHGCEMEEEVVPLWNMKEHFTWRGPPGTLPPSHLLSKYWLRRGKQTAFDSHVSDTLSFWIIDSARREDCAGHEDVSSGLFCVSSEVVPVELICGCRHVPAQSTFLEELDAMKRAF